MDELGIDLRQEVVFALIGDIDRGQVNDYSHPMTDNMSRTC